ncbi:MAG: IPT/TIG domain-containing protein [Acidobacteriota bacterium]|nr:IPT/TIG domain-containing protein [Acidobacteriota bacterium]
MSGKLASIVLFAAIAGCATAQVTAPAVVGVSNGADFSLRLAPGALAAVFGSNFGSGPALSVTATVGGKQAYVINVTPAQLTLQIPTDVPAGTANLVVTVGGASSTPFPVTLDAVSPTIFSANGSGSGLGLIRTSANANVTNIAPAKPGDNLVAYAIGLGPTNPPTLTGTAPTSANPTVSPATLTVGGLPATITYAGIAPGLVATFQVNFTVPAGLQGTQPVVLTIGGKSSSPVGLALFGIGSVVNNASFASAGTASPGSIVSVFANGIGSTDQSLGFPATTFQGVSVSFNGTPAPIFHLTASQGQIDLLVPYELPTSGNVSVQLKTSTSTSLNYMLAMSPAAPGLYFLADPSTKGRFNVLAQFNNTVWLAMPEAMAAALKIPSGCTASNLNPLTLCGQPAAPGDFLVLYTTGLGKATPDGDPNGAQLKTGDIPPADASVLYKTVATPAVTVGGLPAMVVFSGIAPGFPGLYQLDFQVPAGVTGDDVPVAVSIGGSPADTRTIAIRSR